ncbi:MAG TPA: hypothetical protein VGM95_00005 [Lactobacillaceae bacterium]|jgi:peroxiredoxin
MKKVWLVVVAIVVVAAGAMGAMKLFGGPSGGVAGVKSSHYQFMKAAQSDTKQVWYHLYLDTDNAPSKDTIVDEVWTSQNGNTKVFTTKKSLTLGQVAKMSESSVLKKYNHREDRVTEKYFNAHKASSLTDEQKRIKDEQDSLKETEDYEESTASEKADAEAFYQERYKQIMEYSAAIKRTSFNTIDKQNKIADKKGLKATLVSDGTGNKIVGETLEVPHVSFTFGEVDDILEVHTGSDESNFNANVSNFPIYDKYFSGLFSYSDDGNTGLVVRHDKEIKDYVQWDEEGTKNVKVK